MIDPYAVLGVSRNATQDEIKKAYRQKAKQYHPDLHPDDPSAAQKMNEVNEAYDLLQHPEKMKAQQSRESSSGNPYGNHSGQSYGQSGYSYGQNYGRSSGYQNNGNYGNGYTGNRYSYSYGGNTGWNTDFYGFDFADLFGFGSFNSADTTPRSQPGDPDPLVRAITYINQGNCAAALGILSTMTGSMRNARWYYVTACAYYGTGDRNRALEMIRKAITIDPNNRVYQSLYNKYSRTGTADNFGTYRSSNENRENNGYSTSIIRIPSIGRIILSIFAIRFVLRLLRLLFFGF